MDSHKQLKRIRPHYCYVKECRNTSSNSTTSFFSFPKDLERAKKWAVACGREDVLHNAHKLYRIHRVCGTHFETHMFLNDLRNRLQPHAFPIIFKEHSTRVNHTVSYPDNCPKEHNYCKTLEPNEDSSEADEDNLAADNVRDNQDLMMDLSGNSNEISTAEIDLNLAMQSSKLVTLNDPIAGNCSGNEVPPDYSNQIDIATNTDDTITQIEHKKPLNSIKILANDGSKVDACRTCLKMAGDNKINVFDTNNTFKPSLEEMIRSICPGINLKMYDNPMVCVECKNSLEKFYEFKQTLILAEARLNEYNNGCVASTNKQNVNLVILPEELIVKNDGEETNTVRRTKVAFDKPLGTFLCEYCGKILGRNYSYRQHMMRRHGPNSRMGDLTCPICNKEVVNARLKRHMRLHNKPKPKRDPIQCKYCDKTFLLYRAFISHRKTHFRAEERYQCHICGKEDKLHSSLRLHLLSHAPSDWKHECHICHKKFMLKRKLRDHIETHSDMSYMCNICNRRFRKEVSLNRHVDVLHMNLGRHYCMICDKAFYDLSRLKVHMKGKHNIVIVNAIDEPT